MTIKSWLKKTGMAVSLAGALTGCEMLSPEGVAVKQDADGVITQEEENEIGKHLMSKDYANDFTPYIGFVNDFNVFMGGEMRHQGLDERRFDEDMHVYMARDEEEMAEKYAFGNKPGVPPAFHGDTNSTLYILQNMFMPAGLIMTFTHEAGHHFRSSAYEFPSKAHEMYFALRMYGLNKKIGSVFAGKAVPIPYTNGLNLSARCVPVNEYFPEDYKKYYFLGDLGFIVQANLENGNLERAFNNILTRPILYLEESTMNAARQYDNICEASLSEFNKLLDKPGFLQGLLRNVSEKEASELIGYLRFVSTDLNYYFLQESGMPVSSGKMDDFINQTESFYNSGIENALFRNEIILGLAYQYSLKIFETSSSGVLRMEDKIKIHNLAKKIIDINRDLPCESSFFECMGNAAEPNAVHVLAYLSALSNSTGLVAGGVETNNSLLEVVEDFNAKFYPTGNYHFEDTNRNVAVYSSPLLISGGDLEEKLADEDLSNHNPQGYIRHICNAIEWYQATVDAGCSRIPDDGIKAECEEVLHSSIEETAQERIDYRPGFYDRNCR
ncbi:MAG: hypothetical protein PHO02_02605 [Candidatus Nanoarchaeia archaeon]|nr:hypothetical protein [Candidatus Nanoarchaeia archaeon]